MTSKIFDPKTYKCFICNKYLTLANDASSFNIKNNEIYNCRQSKHQIFVRIDQNNEITGYIITNSNMFVNYKMYNKEEYTFGYMIYMNNYLEVETCNYYSLNKYISFYDLNKNCKLENFVEYLTLNTGNEIRKNRHK